MEAARDRSVRLALGDVLVRRGVNAGETFTRSLEFHDRDRITPHPQEGA